MKCASGGHIEVLSQELNSYFFFWANTNIYVCQIDMNIPNVFMEPHEIITSHLWPSEKYFIWIKIIQRTHQPWILLRPIMNNYSGQLSLELGELLNM